MIVFRSREAAIRAEEETGGVEGGETARQRIHRKLRSCQLRWRQPLFVNLTCQLIFSLQVEAEQRRARGGVGAYSENAKVRHDQEHPMSSMPASALQVIIEEREKGESLRQEVGVSEDVLGRLDPIKRGLEEEKEQGSGGSARGGAVSPFRGGRRRGEWVNLLPVKG